MPLLWENLARQLDEVRAADLTGSVNPSGVAQAPRRERLQAALDAIKDKGSPMMVKSLEAALEGREAQLDLPDLPSELKPEMSGPEAFLQGIDAKFKPQG